MSNNELNAQLQDHPKLVAQTWEALVEANEPPSLFAFAGTMAELIDGHIRHHVHSATEREKATDELMEIVRSYLR